MTYEQFVLATPWARRQHLKSVINGTSHNMLRNLILEAFPFYKDELVKPLIIASKVERLLCLAPMTFHTMEPLLSTHRLSALRVIDSNVDYILESQYMDKIRMANRNIMKDHVNANPPQD